MGTVIIFQQAIFGWLFCYALAFALVSTILFQTYTSPAILNSMHQFALQRTLITNQVMSALLFPVSTGTNAVHIDYLA